MTFEDENSSESSIWPDEQSIESVSVIMEPSTSKKTSLSQLQLKKLEQVLKRMEEQQLLTWLLDGSDLGVPRFEKDLNQAGLDVVKQRENQRRINYNELKSHNFVESFRVRHSCVELRAFGEAIDEKKFFQKFLSFLEKNDYLDVLYRPDAFYFMEDANFELEPEKISSDRRLLLHGCLANNRQDADSIRLDKSVTVTYCFGANGRILQQLLIFRDSFEDMIHVALADRKLDSKFLFTKSSNGGNTNSTFKSYLEKVNADLHDVERPIFIFCHETSPHVDLELSKWCCEQRIYIISFIPNDVSIMQMLDQNVFGLNGEGWREEIKSYLEEQDHREFKEVDFVHVLKSLNDRILVEEKIKDAIAESGIFPFDDSKINVPIIEGEDDQKTAEKQQNKEKIVAKIENLQSLTSQLRTELLNEGRNFPVLSFDIIDHQLQFIKSSFLDKSD